MATSFKRLCLRTCPSSARSLQQCRLISSSAPSNATPSSPETTQREETTDLDALTSNPNVKYTVTTSPDTPSSLASLKQEISSRAHQQLAAHRELREMMRLAAWEMPLLAQHAQAFQPPAKEDVLRWRYTTYINDTHPASRKVVVEFNTRALPDLTAAQRLKLEKLAGPRLQPGGKIKMSCENFETVAQNKRYLADTINTLIAEARNDAGDSFEDVPLDLRHQKRKEKLSFPKEWRMTAERRAELDAKRKQALLGEGKRVEEGRMISGTGVIDEVFDPEVTAEEERVMVQAKDKAVAKGKGGQRR